MFFLLRIHCQKHLYLLGKLADDYSVTYPLWVMTQRWSFFSHGKPTLLESAFFTLSRQCPNWHEYSAVRLTTYELIIKFRCATEFFS